MVAFFCNEGLLPEGRITTTCTSNGGWTPNPADLVCIEPPPEDEGIHKIKLMHILVHVFLLYPVQTHVELTYTVVSTIHDGLINFRNTMPGSTLALP